MPDNTVTLVGNLTRDPELRYTPSGQAVVRVGIAVNRRWQNRQTNEWEEQVSFFNVVGWGTLAENVGECLSKGTRIVVHGRMEQRSYEDNEGEKRSIIEVVADEVAPSLRWATCEVQRNERTDNVGARQAPPARGGSGRPAHEYDEEPF